LNRLILSNTKNLAAGVTSDIPTVDNFDGAWFYKQPATIDGIVYDERRGLGTARPVQPMRALDLNGTNQYGWIDVDQVNYPFSLFAWADTDIDGYGGLLSVSDPSSSARFLTLYIDDGNRIYLERRNSSVGINEQSVPLVTGWFSVVVVFQNATTVSVYRNGALLHTFSGLTSVPAGVGFNRFAFGTFRTASPGAYWNGRVMNCGLLRRIATLEDALAFHNTGKILDAEVFLPLDSNSTTVAPNAGLSASWWLNEPRRNLLQYTQSIGISTVYWSPLGATVGSGIVPIITDNYESTPYGPGTRLQFNLGGGGSNSDRSGVSSGIGPPIGTPYSIRFYFKSATPISDATITNNHFGLIAGVGSVTSNTITDMGNGWKRLDQKVTPTASGGTFRLQTLGNVGPNTLDIVIAGMQLELGSVATDYQPIFGSGIEVPEATIINGAAGMLYTGGDVPFADQNKIGYSTRRNLASRTEEWKTSPWSNTGIITENTHIAPDGTLTADTATKILNLSTAVLYELQPLVVSGNTYTLSFFVRAGTSASCAIGVYTSSWLAATGNKVSGPGSIAGSGLLSIGGLTNEWSRFSLTFTAVSGSQTAYFYPRGSAGIGPSETTVFWGFQLELGSTATEYQRIGAAPGTGVLFPPLLADPIKSSAKDTLEFQGPVPMNGQAEEANAFTFDGSDDYIQLPLNDYAGPELVTNGDFSNGATGWTSNNGTIAVSSGELTVTNTGSAFGTASLAISTIVGRTYKISCVARRGTASQSFLQVKNSSPVAPSNVASFSTTSTTNVTLGGVFIATAATSFICLVNNNTNNGTSIFDNVSVKELPTSSELGINRVVNGDFDTDIANWTNAGGSSASWVSGTMQITGGATFGGRWQDVPISTPATVTVRVRRVSGVGNAGLAVSDFGSFSNIVFAASFVSTNFTDYSVQVSPANGGVRVYLQAQTSASDVVFQVESVSVRQFGTIQHQGTSILTYRSQGDGITGTAGTAYDIRLGDVGWIPCSEGHGDQVHDVLRDLPLQIVNGQFSNWTTKQNTFHYNLTEGNNVVNADTVDADPLVDFTGATQGVWFDPSDISTLFQDAAGTIPAANFGDRVRLQLDKSKGLVLGSELRQNGVIGIIGTAPAATYNTSTGIGSVSRTDISNQSFVVFPTVAGRYYQVNITSVSGGVLWVRVAGSGGTVVRAVNPGGSFSGLIESTSSSFVFTCEGGTCSFTLTSIKELPGYHKVFPSDAARAFRGRMPKVGVRNVLTRTAEFSDAAWGKAGLNTSGTPQWVFPGQGPNGSSAFKVILSNGISASGATSNGLGPIGSVASGVYRYSIHLKSAEVTSARFRENISVGSFLIIDLINGVVTSGGGPGTQFIDPLVTDAGNGWWRVSFTTPTMTNLGKYVVRGNQDGDGVSGILATSAQVELGSTTTNYQTVTNIDDVSEEGQDDCYYLRVAGAQSASTPAINFSYTDEMTVIGGLRKTSDASVGVYCETRGNLPVGGWYVAAPNSTGDTYGIGSRGSGTGQTQTYSGFASPHTAIITFLGDIAGSSASARINGVQQFVDTDSQGTGNYGNHIIDFYARNNSSLYWTGFDFGTLIFGKAMSTYSVQKYENFIAKNTPTPEPNITAPLRIPASQLNPGFDVLGNVLSNKAVIGVNGIVGPESTINFSPVANSWPDTYSIPGADLPNYAFDGNSGDLDILIDTSTREAKFRLENQ
jgi:hypothetical protein